MDQRQVKICDFQDRWALDFARINQAWIEKNFGMESLDKLILSNPRQEILEKGGFILFALDQFEVIGTCALKPCPSKGYDFELTKMGVDENARRKGIEKRLALAALEKARANGAKTVYLETNKVLKPAIELYKKLGFTALPQKTTLYQRCNLQMVLNLESQQ